MRGFLNQNWVCIHKEKREEDVGKATKCPSQYEPLCGKMRRLYNSSSSSFIHSFIHWLDGYLLGAYSVLSPRQTYWGTSGIFQILHIFFIHLPHMEASSHIKRQTYSHGTLKKKKKTHVPNTPFSHSDLHKSGFQRDQVTISFWAIVNEDLRWLFAWPNHMLWLGKYSG